MSLAVNIKQFVHPVELVHRLLSRLILFLYFGPRREAAKAPVSHSINKSADMHI